MSESRRQRPPLHDPHGFNVAWLQGAPRQGMLAHRHHATQVVVARNSRWQVRLNTGADEQLVELGHLDSLSIPPGVWRSMTCLDAAGNSGELLVVNGGDGRVELEWADQVVEQARNNGWVLDPNHYLAPRAVLESATEDD